MLNSMLPNCSTLKRFLVWMPFCDLNILTLHIRSHSIWFCASPALIVRQNPQATVLDFYPADRQLNYFAFSQRPKWNIISRLRFKLKPWQEPCLRRPAETFQPPLPLLTPDWHMGWIRKHEPCDVMTNWPRGDRFGECFAHWPQARVKYVYVVHVDFIWSSIISSQTLNCDPPPWETRARQETVCFCNQQTGINY